MKMVKLFFRYSLLAGLFSAVSFASGTMRGTLHTGQDIVLTPINAHALSITHTRGKFTSHSSFNFIMMNKGDILYSDKNQVDDVYLVFHDDVEANDRIKIHVNRGYFNYKIAPLQTLPTVVKNVLDPVVFKSTSKPKRKETRPLRKKVKKESPTIQKPVFIKPEPVPVVAPIVHEAPQVLSQVSSTVPTPRVETSVRDESPIGDSFFEKFTKIFEELVASLASTEREEVTNRLKEVPAKPKTIPVEPKGIEMDYDDANLLRIASENEKEFRQATPQEISNTVNDRALQMEAQPEKKRAFSAPKEIVVGKYIPTTAEEKFSGTHSYQPLPSESGVKTQRESVPHFSSQAPAQTASIPEPIAYTKESVPTFSTAPASVATIPAQEAVQTPQKVVLNEVVEEKVPTQRRAINQVATSTIPQSTPYYPDTGYKEGYESLEQTPKPAQVVEAPTVAVVEDRSLPTAAEVTEGEEDKRLVITKIIDRPEVQTAPADPFAGRVLGRMDDRVLGNGYDGASHVGKLGMRVTKNNRPVSAWIEVFKNGTKQRVKTFYTSKGRSAKSVKLPAGTYMVRATYRSRDSKQQKTIKNIHLKEGGNVNRSIAFHDGKLRVIAKRGDKPLYVKVIAYKSGTRKRVSYDFSSRNSGIAMLSLGSGTYDIEVIDHKNNRVFDNIHIRGGGTETINVDF